MLKGTGLDMAITEERAAKILSDYPELDAARNRAGTAAAKKQENSNATIKRQYEEASQAVENGDPEKPIVTDAQIRALIVAKQKLAAAGADVDAARDAARQDVLERAAKIIDATEGVDGDAESDEDEDE